MNDLKRHDLIQSLQNRNLPQEVKSYGLLKTATMIGFGILIGAAIIPLTRSCDKAETKRPMSEDCYSCHRKAAMIDYFKKSGNPHPEAMAVAVLQTKYPRLLAAMAVKGEKNTPYTVRRGGWKKQHAGAWQQNEKYWGKVPYTPIEQALKTENILEDLTKAMPIEEALSYYGGDSTSKYANRVLAELVNIP